MMNKKKILILTSKIQKQTVQRINTNKPQIRHHNIITNAPENVQINYVEQKLTSQKLKSLQVHHQGLINFLQGCYQSYQSKPDHGYTYFQTGITPYTFIQDVSKIQILSKLDYWKQAGIWGKDVMTPIFKNTWKTILQSANNCYLVPEYMNKQDKFEVIYCLNMYPGHHASNNTYGGYCFLNNGAICAKGLQQNGYSKIAILDLDYHAGDGTQRIFRNNQSVITVSIHADPLLDYPFYSNFESQYQTDKNKNISFGPNTDGEKYLQHLKQAINFINKFQYDCLIIAFGGDTYKNDPDASQFCRCRLDFQDYYKIGEFIKKNSKNKSNPIIVTQQGGYDMENIHKVVFKFLQGLSL